MFTIYNFEESVSDTILKRGRDYYDNGHVKKVKESGRGNWEAQVKGNDKYEVAIVLKDDLIVKNYDCDCPYDGNLCKHVVALLYYLNEKLTIDVTPKKQTVEKKATTKKITFEDLLNTISLKEYQDFIGYYATSDKNFKTNFELYFSDKNNNFNIEKTYTTVIKKLVRKYSDRGFMDYRSSKAFANELGLLIKTAYDYFNKDNFRDSLALTKTLIIEATKPIEWCDDSSGMLGDALSNTINLLGQMVTDVAVPFSVKEQVVDFLAIELAKSIYFDYGDFGYDMTAIFLNASKTTARHDDFIGFIDKKIKDYRHDSYGKEFFTTKKIEFLTAINRTKDAELLTSANMEIVEIRTLEIEKLKTDNNLTAAKQLINEGITIAEKKAHGGTVRNWHKELYKIAVLEKDLTAMRSYAKTLAFDSRFDSEYYNIWKSTYNEKEWQEAIESYISNVTHKTTEEHKEQKNSYYKLPLHIELLNALSNIYIQENFTDRILDLIKTGYNLDLLVKYHALLLPEYSIQLLNMYLVALEKQCEHANGRGEYKQLANVMKQIIKTIPDSKDEIIEVAQKLIKKYPRRPAMIDEFNKI